MLKSQDDRFKEFEGDENVEHRPRTKFGLDMNMPPRFPVGDKALP